MKKGKKTKEAQEQALRRREAQQNQDDVRLRTLQKYGLEYRGKHMEKQQNTLKTNKRRQRKTEEKTETNKEKKKKQKEQQRDCKQHL